MSESDNESFDSFILVNEDADSSKTEIEICNENISICNIPNASINSSNLNRREADDYDFGSILMVKGKESTTTGSNNENGNQTECIEKNEGDNYTCPTIESGLESFCKVSENFDESPKEEFESIKYPVMAEDYNIKSVVKTNIESQIMSDSQDEKMENTKPINNILDTKFDINNEDNLITKEIEFERDNSFERLFRSDILNNFESNGIDYDSKLSEDIFSEYNSINDELEANSISEKDNLEIKADGVEVKKTVVITNIGDKVKMENIEDISKLVNNDFIEPVTKNDETDFRVNVLQRHDSEDIWETNKYIESDNTAKSIDFALKDHNRLILPDEIFNKETSGKSDLTDDTKLENKLPVTKNDETDFRVNVLQRHNSEDIWETNKYIESDNTTESIDFALKDHNRLVLPEEIFNKETSGKSDLTEDTELENEFQNLGSSKNQKTEFGIDIEIDDTDFRVNVLRRDDSKDVWETNQYIQNDNSAEHIDSAKYICDNSVLANGIENRVTENEFNLMKEKKIEDTFQVSESLRNIKTNNEKINIDLIGNRNIDESDFRVSVLARNDSKDCLENDQYIHSDNDVSENTNVCNIPVLTNFNDIKDSKEKLNIIYIPEVENNFQNGKPLEDKVHYIENDVKVDEADFRNNLLTKDDSKDVWETNKDIDMTYIQNEINNSENIDICNNPVLTNESDIMNTKEESEDMDSENKLRNLEILQDKKGNIENEVSVDESDFRVNVLTRYDSEDIWETNQYINNENVLENDDFTTKNLNQMVLTNKIYNSETKEEPKSNFQILESLQDMKIDSDMNLESVGSVGEGDLVVNVSNKYDLEDIWETNQNIPNNNYEGNVDCYMNDLSGPILIDPVCNRKKNEDNDLTEKAESEHEFFSLKSLPDLNISDEKNDLNFENELPMNENNLQNISLKEENIEKNNSLKTNQSIQENNEIIEDKIPEMQVREKRSIIIEKQKKTHVSSKALGSNSPSNFNSLNAIICMLFHCSPFRTEIINYHCSDNIASIDLDGRNDITTEDAFFINDLCKLFDKMSSEKGISFKSEVESVQRYFRCQSKKFDIYKGYSYILSKINLITKTENKKPFKSNNEADISFNNYKSLNYGFISDLFYGQKSIKIFCKNCQTTLKDAYQPMNSIKLTIPKIQTTTYLEACIKNYFSEHPYKNDRYKCCNRSNLVRHRQMTHAPEYLFLYTDLSATNGDTNQNYIGSYNGFIIETEKGIILYSIDSVIDKIQTNNWRAKCFSDNWWIIDDMKIKKIREFDIISEHSVGFLLKKQHDG